jgi:hypothetical protein
VQKILSAIGDDRIHSSKLELAQHFNGDMDVKNVKSVFKKLIVGKDGCTMLELQWVPDSLKAIGQPENVMGCGAPHLHMFTTGCHKVGPKDIPFWGFSQFILGISGACWLVSWPASFATDLSLPVESLFDIVAHQKKDVFTNFFQQKVFHCLLTRNTVAWVPCGHCFTLIPLQDQEHDRTVALTIPYLNVNLMHNAETVALHAVRDVIHKHRNSQHCMDQAAKFHPALDQFLQWFRDSSKLDDKFFEDGQQNSEPEAETQIVSSKDLAGVARLPATQVAEADGSQSSVL